MDGTVAVAIKILRPTKDPIKDLISWHNEHSIYLSCLKHANIVTTFDQFISDRGNLIIVMEKAIGSLEDVRSSRDPFSPKTVCVVGIQLLRALEHIHSLGVIHRDITPRNVLVFDDGRFKLSDFGISKTLVSATEFAKTFIGFKNAIPPELLKQGYSTTQSDIYQLGLVLLSLLVGDDPISRNASNVYELIAQGVPRQTAELLQPKHGRLAELLAIMLRRRDAYRFKTATEVREEFEDEFRRLKIVEEAVQKFLRLQETRELPPQTPED